jgi:hypothetical protein
MEESKISNNFWISKKEYPNYPFIKERRKYELDFLLENIPKDTNTLLDIGCGDGSTVILLRETTYIKDFYCYDIAEGLMSGNWGERDSKIIKKTVDFNIDRSLPVTDVTISMNIFPCIFDDAVLDSIIGNIKSDIFLTRITCEHSERLTINKYSEDLSDHIASVYRTVEEYLEVLKKYYPYVEYRRSFPDKIESKYGTKQYFFICKR